MECSSLVSKGGGESVFGHFESTVLSILHLLNDRLHLGKGRLNCCLEDGKLLGDEGLEFMGSVVVSILELFLKLVDGVPCIFADFVDFSNELLDFFPSGSKS